MSDKQGEVRTIHSRAIAALGMEACVVMLGVARDLRSGVIPPHRFDQGHYCGTACCIAGHTAFRLGAGDPYDWAMAQEEKDPALYDNYGGLFGNDLQTLSPDAAADATERYVYDGSEHPWLTEEEIKNL